MMRLFDEWGKAVRRDAEREAEVVPSKVWLNLIATATRETLISARENKNFKMKM
jgi:hypothetical protein